MILTPIPDSQLPESLARFDDSLASESSHAVFQRIAGRGNPARAAAGMAVRNHSESIDLITSFGIGHKPGSPRLDLSWDSAALRSETEAYVLLHEVAHYQLAAPARRTMIEFGLGPGPETGDLNRAQRAAVRFGIERDREEALASLLGILWETQLGHPALASFLDQNWLEGAGRRSTAAHFESVLAELARGGFVTPSGQPTRTLRQSPD